MKSTVETLSPTRVRLAIEVPFAELEPSLKKAYREIGSQVTDPRVPPGKVPTAVIDQRVGRGTVLNEAVQDAIPTQIVAAVREHEVKTLGRPEVEITEFADGQPLKFTAELDVRPEITLPDLASIEVTVDEVEIGDEEIDDQVNALRERFATLKTVERPAAERRLRADRPGRHRRRRGGARAAAPPTSPTRSAATSSCPAWTTRWSGMSAPASRPPSPTAAGRRRATPAATPTSR